MYHQSDPGSDWEGLLMAFLEVEHLKYRYPHAKKLALDDISFTAEKGEFIGIIGETVPGKARSARHFAGWFRSSIRALTAVK